jgi:hypothetical protein
VRWRARVSDVIAAFPPRAPEEFDDLVEKGSALSIDSADEIKVRACVAATNRVMV